MTKPGALHTHIKLGDYTKLHTSLDGQQVYLLAISDDEWKSFVKCFDASLKTEPSEVYEKLLTEWASLPARMGEFTELIALFQMTSEKHTAADLQKRAAEFDLIYGHANTLDEVITMEQVLS